MPDTSEDPATTCCACGAVAAGGRPVTWSLEVGPGVRRWLCEACTRDNVRSIEAKLDEAWW